mgnify:FL=1
MSQDRIILSGLRFYGYHGVHPEERTLGQIFVLDLEIGLDLSPAARTDDPSQTVNYSEVYKDLRDVVQGNSYKLIETLAQKVAEVVLCRDKVLWVRVTVKKPAAPIHGANFDFVAVQVYREKPPAS